MYAVFCGTMMAVFRIVTSTMNANTAKKMRGPMVFPFFVFRLLLWFSFSSNHLNQLFTIHYYLFVALLAFHASAIV